MLLGLVGVSGVGKTYFKEKIVQELEKGELNLDDSINKFEEGMKLSKSASKYLEEAEKKITVLINSKDGEIAEEEF